MSFNENKMSPYGADHSFYRMNSLLFNHTDVCGEAVWKDCFSECSVREGRWDCLLQAHSHYWPLIGQIHHTLLHPSPGFPGPYGLWRQHTLRAAVPCSFCEP